MSVEFGREQDTEVRIMHGDRPHAGGDGAMKTDGDVLRGRWGAASGLVALLFGAAGTGFERGMPAAGASGADVAAFVAANRDALLAQSLLFLLGAAFTLWFVASVRSAMAGAEAGTRGLSALFLGAATGYVALSVVAQAGQVAVARVAGSTASAELVSALSVLSWALFTVASVPVAVALAAFAVLSWQTGAFPSWLGVLAAVAAVTQVGLLAGIVVHSGPFSPTGWYTYVPYPLFALWLAATAVVLLRARP